MSQYTNTPLLLVKFNPDFTSIIAFEPSNQSSGTTRKAQASKILSQYQNGEINSRIGEVLSYVSSKLNHPRTFNMHIVKEEVPDMGPSNLPPELTFTDGEVYTTEFPAVNNDTGSTPEQTLAACDMLVVHCMSVGNQNYGFRHLRG